MRVFLWVIVLVSSVAFPALADEPARPAAKPVVIDPRTPHAGHAGGPLVILVGEAAKLQQASQTRLQTLHRRRSRNKSAPIIAAH